MVGTSTVARVGVERVSKFTVTGKPNEDSPCILR